MPIGIRTYVSSIQTVASLFNSLPFRTGTKKSNNQPFMSYFIPPIPVFVYYICIILFYVRIYNKNNWFI